MTETEAAVLLLAVVMAVVREEEEVVEVAEVEERCQVTGAPMRKTEAAAEEEPKGVGKTTMTMPTMVVVAEAEEGLDSRARARHGQRWRMKRR